MDKFNTYLTGLDLNFWRRLCFEKGELRQYKKGDYFCRIGERVKMFGFIESGSFKYCVNDSEGKEHITGFSLEGTPVTDYLSLTTRSKARANIVALANADVFVCEGKMAEQILRYNSQLHAQIADNLLTQTYDRFLDLYRKSAKERYMDFLAQSPEILQQISLKELASYLQITPTYLSRIRKEITFQ